MSDLRADVARESPSVHVSRQMPVISAAEPFDLAAPPTGRLVTTVDELVVRAPVMRIFEIAAAVEWEDDEGEL
jgi:hypothetical protein